MLVYSNPTALEVSQAQDSCPCADILSVEADN